jgi:hypothetical protein
MVNQAVPENGFATGSRPTRDPRGMNPDQTIAKQKCEIFWTLPAARPIVVPNLPSVSQTIVHGTDGLVCQEGPLDDAKKLLNDLSNRDTFRITLGMNARRKVIEQYQLECAVEDFKNTVIPTLLHLKYQQ